MSLKNSNDTIWNRTRDLPLQDGDTADIATWTKNISRKLWWWHSLWKQWRFLQNICKKNPPHTLEEFKTLSRKIEASRKLFLTGFHQTGRWCGWMYRWICWRFQNCTAALPLLSYVIYSFDKQTCFREWFVWLFEHSAQWSVKYKESSVRNVALGRNNGILNP